MKEKRITDEKKEEMREATIADSFTYTYTKERFGLFGAPSSTAIGDDGGYQKTKCHKTDEGVETGPRNFYNGLLKFKGILKAEEAVHDPGFITNATGDPYKPAQIAGLRTMTKDGYKKGGHDYNFKPAKYCTFQKSSTQAPYEYKENGPMGNQKKRQYRDADGAVIIEPRGFLTNPVKRGRTRSVVFEDYEYKGDDYNAKNKMVRSEIKLHHDTMEKVCGDSYKPFSQRAERPKFYNGNFNTIKEIIGEEPLPPIPQRRDKKDCDKCQEDGTAFHLCPCLHEGKRFKRRMPSCALAHDLDFKPGGTKFGKVAQQQDFIGRFPEYMCFPPKELQKQPPPTDDQRGWCCTFKERTRPTPSVALNYRNLKSSFPSAFKMTR